jgi:VWFA-related protein
VLFRSVDLSWSRRALLWLGALLLGSFTRAQTPADSPTVTIKSSVRLVQVDVIAKDKHGNPIPGLEAKDFTLLDDGKPQKISHLSIERAESATGVEKAASGSTHDPTPTAFSNSHPENAVPTVILFDVLNTAVEDQPAMKKGLLQSLNGIKEGTPVALLILGDDLTVVSDFTTSTISLTKAAGNGLGLRAEGFGPAIIARKTGNPKRDSLILKATSQAFRVEDRERMVRTLAALNLICQQLAPMRGRKSLIWVAGGLSASGQSTEVEDAIDKLNDANVAVYTIDARGVLLDSGLTAEADTNNLTAPLQEERELTRGDVLAVMANSTGGVGYYNTNRLDGAIRQALGDRSLVYVLDYYPQHGEWHGKRHKLQVKTSRSGVRLRYRASYRATLPARPNAQEREQMLAEVASSPLDFAGIHFTIELKPGYAADPEFVLHVPAEELQWSADEGKMGASLQMWFVQKRATGEDLVTTGSKSDLRLSTGAYQAVLRDGIALASDVILQRSAAKVRVLLRDGNSGKIGSVDVPVDSSIAAQPVR